MRSPFSFISSSVRVVTLAMSPFQLGDFAPPEIAVGQLRMRKRQLPTPYSLGAVPHDVEVQRPRPPALAALSAPLRLDRPAVRQQRGRLETRFEQNHLVQKRGLRNRSQ